MHRMFVKLFLENDTDDLPAVEKHKRRPATLAVRNTPRITRRSTARIKDHRPRR